MTAFYKEAVRIWDLEAGQSSLPRIHAGVCLCKLTHSISSHRLSSRGGRAPPSTTVEWASSNAVPSSKSISEGSVLLLTIMLKTWFLARLAETKQAMCSLQRRAE
jgi:hypothetical protein